MLKHDPVYCLRHICDLPHVSFLWQIWFCLLFSLGTKIFMFCLRIFESSLAVVVSKFDFPAAAAWGFFVSLIFCWKKFLCLSNYKFVSCVKFQSGAQCKKWGKNTGCIWLKDFEFFWKVNSSQSSKIKKFSGHHSLQKVQIYFYVSSKWK